MHKAAINTRDKAGINSALCVYIYTRCAWQDVSQNRTHISARLCPPSIQYINLACFRLYFTPFRGISSSDNCQQHALNSQNSAVVTGYTSTCTGCTGFVSGDAFVQSRTLWAPVTHCLHRQAPATCIASTTYLLLFFTWANKWLPERLTVWCIPSRC